ncbi:hypothetical protein VNO80_04555 [Phaseolus coccineus]|uniref:Secreted protein n=1 Tax=Phaseolus coccineus TaxID=3886 RepID=A0AAN9NY30_PHACN
MCGQQQMKFRLCSLLLTILWSSNMACGTFGSTALTGFFTSSYKQIIVAFTFFTSDKLLSRDFSAFQICRHRIDSGTASTSIIDVISSAPIQVIQSLSPIRKRLYQQLKNFFSVDCDPWFLCKNGGLPLARLCSGTIMYSFIHTPAS